MRRMFIIGSDAFLVTTMRVALRYGSGINVLGVLDDGADIAQAVREAEPDFVLIDASRGSERALAHLRDVRQERPDALIILLATELDIDVFESAAELGALACLGPAALLPQLQALLAEPAERNGSSGHVALTAAGQNGSATSVPPAPEIECPLTKRELEILKSVAEGHTNARIGRDLWVTEQTVKFHLSKIYRKLGVANRTEASRYALLNDLFGARRATHRPAAPVARVGVNGVNGVNGVAHVNGHVNGHRVLDHAQR
jgi:DNA-binding NarL/FixJ family response regulator